MELTKQDWYKELLEDLMILSFIVELFGGDIWEFGWYDYVIVIGVVIGIIFYLF